ncbi:DEAD/DEAH box helicase [Candidatus Heimdallarchaeota archaeon]|nr:MAG: DEAD/DEAH box helicase [Candidatus Heimdallarchaeota archaeon]
MFLPEIISIFESKDFKSKITWQVNRNYSLPYLFKKNFKLRSYQKKALTKWKEAQKKGVVVLPTGSGKTFIALQAMELAAAKTLIIVPTITLIEQWLEKLTTHTNLTQDKIGVYGGGEQILKPITISTYDSGHLYSRRFRDYFGLLICDEVHHLPTESYRKIAEQLVAPYRLGLTATLKRPDEKHLDVEDKLIGPIIFHLKPGSVQEEGYVSRYTLEKVYVDLTAAEAKMYKHYQGIYRRYLAQKNIRLKSGLDFQNKLVKRMSWDHKARKAVKAHHKSRSIALTASNKLQALNDILGKHAEESILIFAEFTEMVELASKTFLIPAITHKTPKRERQVLLKKFEEGTITKLITGRVLDEGFDVQKPSIGIILSGSGVERQYIQRLGRLLRPREGKTAKLYEIIAKDTLEEKTSERRREKASKGQRKEKKS